MLHYACHYGVRAAHWWEMVQEPSRRREVIETLLDDESVKGVHTALNCALRDKSWGGQGDAVAPALLRGLLQFAAERDPDQLLPAALQFIKAVLPGESGWQSHALGPLEDIQLAELALTDQPYARDALSLIAHTRSRAAIDVLAAEIPSRRATAALSEVRSRTGALPSSIPASVRWKILREITRKQITADRSTLSAALILTALGGIIGFGLYVFITYRLPTFLDLQRILVSVERSLILGGGVGLGLFTARWLGARLRVVSIPVRLSLGTVGAAILIALAELIYYPVMLNRPVDGGLLWVGILILGLAFGAAGVVGKRIVSGVLVFLSLIGVILSSWLAALTSGETPLLAFETSWSLLQVGMLALLVSFPLAVLGNVIDLRVKGESRSTGGAGPGG
jgi:hypothetical protein